MATAINTSEQPPFREFPQKGPSVEVERGAGGVLYVRSGHEPGEAPETISHLFLRQAEAHPDRPFLKQREPDHGPWRGVTYGEASAQARAIAAWLKGRGLGQDDSVMVLSPNSIEHGLLMLGCYVAGVPVAPVSAGYSLLSADHEKLRYCLGKLKPAVVFVQDSGIFDRAISTVKGVVPDACIVSVDGGGETTPWSELIASDPLPVDMPDAPGPDSVAKYLFTSGSTGMPKCVPQTHRMMTSQIAAAEGLRLREDDGESPEGLEWMPWSHISAGNISFNGNIAGGGTLHLDEGKPLPGMFETTIANLREVSPRVFGSAPVAFAMLADAMEKDEELRRSFFRNLIYMGYGGATLSSDLYDRMQALAIAETGERIPMVTMYGATETQGITTVHWATDRVGLIGLPLPGITLKLVPNADKYEVRVKGPTVTSGYLGDEEKSAAAFDEEGYYRLGDAARFLDPDDPEKGLVFDGRVTEDFKLDTGTWVSVGTLRPDIVAACSPLIFDAVITGQDKPFIGAMIWPSQAAAATFAKEHGADAPQRLREAIAGKLKAFNASSGGSSRRIGRFLLLDEPPTIDSGELTDKGYVNQRAVLGRRADKVNALYGDLGDPEVVDLA